MDYIPTLFSFNKTLDEAANARQNRLMERRFKQQFEDEEKKKAEQKCLEREHFEQEAALGLSMLNNPFNIGTQTEEAHMSCDTSEQTETSITCVQLYVRRHKHYLIGMYILYTPDPTFNVISAVILEGDDTKTKFYVHWFTEMGSIYMYMYECVPPLVVTHDSFV